MEITDGNENVRILDERREKLMAKLAQRNEDRKIGNNDSEAKNEESRIDDLLKNIRIDLDDKKVDSEKVEKLQKYLTYSLGNRRSKAIQNLLEEVRKFKISQKPVTKFTGFSFSKTKASTSKTPDLPKKAENGSSTAQKWENSTGPEENVVENLKDEKKVISGKNLEEITLKNIENCRLEFDFEPSVVHIRNIKNSKLLFSRCDRSILMHDCEDVNIYVAAQQIRVHTSKNIHLHVATRGAVILEETNGVLMSPYKMKRKDGTEIIETDNDEWKTPRDFDWLATSQSPNWALVDESDWEYEQFIL